jgi:2-oxo-3-hexenedioate decarboxylase/2-keto-4-pentenoate hydratase
MEEARAEKAARWLYERRETRQDLAPLPPSLRPADLAEAYAAQEALLALYADAGKGPIGGYKIALTTKVMQRLMGVDQPCGGTILAPTNHRSPARLACAEFVHVGVECEIAMRLGADLDPAGAPYTAESIAGAVAACMPAIEIIEDQNAVYGNFDALDLVAANAWNGGCVLGEEVRDWRRLDLAALRGRMTIAGKEVGTGIGADALGHPLAALAALANTLLAHGRPLRRDMVFITGSLVSTRWPEPGEEVVVEIEELGRAAARFV